MKIDTSKQDWHCMVGLQPIGPLSLDDITARIAAGELRDSTLIATKAAANWRPAGEVLNEVRAGNLAGSQLPPLSNMPGSTPGVSAKPTRSLLDQIGDTLNQVAGTEKLEGFSLGEMFSETFQKRSAAEMEEYFIVGTERTTPAISEVQTGWPKPWLFMRLFLFFVVLYAGFVLAYEQFQNANLIPGLLLMGAFAMPLATLVLFFELNTPRNVSIYRILVLLGLGGIASLAISLIGFNIGHLDWLGASSAGIIEELGKLFALVLIVRGARYRYILNGMLFGAAVGAGFAAFESAGYAFRYFEDYGTRAMLDTIWWRALFAPMGHVAWTAMVGAALWRVKGHEPITKDTLLDPRFYRVLLLAMALHMLWDCPLHPPFYIKELTLGAIAWFVIWGLVQQGLRQVLDYQRAVETATQSTIIQMPSQQPKSA